ncbi:MAG: S41 family peptidase [Muribaculaceae bacterium]|nr:S41 family peptidase [Muribaculaceae bacterium]
MKYVRYFLLLPVLMLCICAGAAKNEPIKGFDKIGYTNRIIETFYLDSVDNDKLAEEAIVAMLKTLDPHSLYSNPEETKELVTPLEGNFSGIGIQFNMLNDTLIVIQTTSGGPSEKVGLLPGDKILSADTTVISGVKRPRSEIMKALRGPKGTRVDVKVARRNVEEPIVFRITRDDIPVNSVDAAYMAAPGIGYIRLSRFAENSFDEVAAALKKLEKQGMKSLIFDLEDNGGGILGTAVQIAELFLDKDCLVTYTESPKLGTSPYITRSKGRYADMPLTVMVNQYSASASEILSGALQDHDRAVVVGRRTFGKGLVQRPFPFPDGSMIRLTVARYHTPSGRVIQKPYEPGKAEDYAADIKARYDNGEFYSADSISFPDSLKYTTLKRHRTVYGGGGIMPDRFVAIDTTLYTPYYRDLMAKGVFNTFCLGYTNDNRKELVKKYDNEEKFVTLFNVSDDIMQAFVNQGEKDGVPVNDEELERSRPLIAAIIKGIIGRDLFDTSTYFRIVNPLLNPIYKEALDIIGNRDVYEGMLQGHK